QNATSTNQVRNNPPYQVETPLVDTGAQTINVRSPLYGAYGDVQTVFDGATDGSTANLTCATSAPSANAVARMTVLVAAPAATGLSGLTVQFGHDDTAAIQAAINAAGTALYTLPSATNSGSAEVFLPSGNYFINATSLLSPKNVATGGYYNWRSGSIILRGA